VQLFKDLGVEVLTKWRDAHRRLLDSDAWRADPELAQLPTLDVLLAFEDFARVQEREFEEQMRRAQVDKTRRERKAREAFKVLSTPRGLAVQQYTDERATGAAARAH
jgi:pre-mRNA-processing factor 40